MPRKSFFQYATQALIATSICSLSLPAAFAGGIERSPTSSGFYLSAGLYGVGIQSSDSNVIETVGGVNHVGTMELLEKDSMNFGWGANAGWQFNNLFRMDLAYFYANLPLTGNVLSSSLGNAFARATGISNMGFVDAYLDVMSMFSDRSAFFHPYIGGGVGFSSNQLINYRQNNNDGSIWAASNYQETDFAWRAIVGLNFPFTDHFMAYTQYSYVSAGQYAMGNSLSAVNSSATGTANVPGTFNIYSNMLGVGITYLF